MNNEMLQHVISINNRCVDQLHDENIFNVISELHQQGIATCTAASNSSAVNAPNMDLPQEVQRLDQPNQSPVTMTVRIQFRSDAISTSTLTSSEFIPVLHSKSPIVACLCPILLVMDDSLRRETPAPSQLQPYVDSTTGSTVASSPPSSSSMKDDLHLISTAILLNIGMMLHRFALRYSERPEDDGSMMKTCGREVAQPRSATAPYWLRATELYEILITLFHNDLHRHEMNIDHNNDCHCGCCDRQSISFIIGMKMMKAIVYNNYAQICYDMGHYTRYFSCMTSLLHHHAHFHDDDDSSDSTTETTAYYEPIRQTIQLNVWIYQILAVPIIARAA